MRKMLEIGILDGTMRHVIGKCDGRFAPVPMSWPSPDSGRRPSLRPASSRSSPSLTPANRRVNC